MSTPVLSIRVLNIQEEGLIFQDKPRTEKNKLQNPSGAPLENPLRALLLARDTQRQNKHSSTGILFHSSLQIWKLGEL